MTASRPQPLLRSQLLDRLRNTPDWDLIVIGGGATGLGVALDATTRGLRTVLLEAGDFAQGASSRSTKLIHGGVRYLAQGNLALVRESLRERGLLLRNAPAGLVRPLGFVVPCYRWGELPYFAAGLKLYDALAGRLGLAPSRVLSAAEVARELPALRRRDPAGRALKGGILYFDAQFDDARLSISLMRTIHAHGGLALNGCPVTGFLRSGERIAGVAARDAATGENFEVKGRAVVNATGAWGDDLRRQDDPTAQPLLAPSQGTHLVLDESFLPGSRAILQPRSRDGRVLFCLPWMGRTLVGTTDTPRSDHPADPKPLPGEIELLLAGAGELLKRQPTETDIHATFSGLRPLVQGSRDTPTRRLSRDHLIVRAASGLITITGGKWTTYRLMAEDVVDRVLKELGRPPRRAVTADLPLEPLDYGPDTSPRLQPEFPWTEQDVRNACQFELARNIDDVLLRRTRLGMVDEDAARALAGRVGELMDEEFATA
ncbi:MAG: glycerol-3-phosphate dehydrogenase/oxidase [Zoogloeaceae bacterium]|nr:glycerol-3-phosphate dehydrogenase/oxidase [Zoogloeaceae bacterium]